MIGLTACSAGIENLLCCSAAAKGGANLQQPLFMENYHGRDTDIFDHQT